MSKYGALEKRNDALAANNNNNNAQSANVGPHNNSLGQVQQQVAEEQLKLELAEEESRSILHRAAKRIPCLGILLALCASLFLSSAGMLVKMTSSVHGIQVAVFRAIIQMLVYGLVIKLRNLKPLPYASELVPVMGRAFLGASSITCSYCALKMIPLGDATTIRFSLPIWTLIISYLVLNESCSIFKVLAVIVSISGVILIAKPEDCIYLANMFLRAIRLESDSEFQVHLDEYELSQQEDVPDADVIALGDKVPIPLPTITNEYQLEGSLLALTSSICLSLSLVSLRLCKRTPAEITILWLSLVSILVGTLTLIAMDELRFPNNWLDVLYIFLNGICGSIGQWFITSALKIEQSGVISLARTFDIEVAFLYSAFLLHEQIRITSIVGSVLVSFGVIAVIVPKWLQSSNTNQSSASCWRFNRKK